MEKKFTVDWFSEWSPTWTHFLAELKDKPDLKGLEIGVFQGRSTCWLLDNIFTAASAHLDCVDPFTGSAEHENMDEIATLFETFQHNTQEYGDKIETHKMMSHEFLVSKGQGRLYDFVYVDGDHHSWACLEDMVLAWRLLKKDGIMIVDDFGYGQPDPTPPHMFPIHGIMSFLNAYTTQYQVLFQGYQIILRKTCS